MTTPRASESSANEAKNPGTDAMPVRLRCLAGGAMPDDMRRDATRLDKLTDSLFGALPAVLGALVIDPMTADLGQQLTRMCLRHEVAEADVGYVMRVVRWLMREAAAADLDRGALEQDMRTIWRDPRGLLDVVLNGYEPIKNELRRQLLNDALLKHGNVLVDMDWRVDIVAADRHAAKLMSPLAMVTLSYRDAEATRRLTLQLLPDQLARLSQVFGALAQRTRKPTSDGPED